VLEFRSTDNAGNVESPGSVSFKIDATPPAITVTRPAAGGVYLLDAVVNADYGCTDGGSGLATCIGNVPSGSPFDTSSVAFHGFVVTASDSAGNASSKIVSYQVVWPFTGFFPPVDSPPTVNVANAGSSVPVKFSLGGDRGLEILPPGSPGSVKVGCASGAAEDTLEETATAGQSELRFTGGQYVYVWKTEKAWAGTCRELRITLADGSVRKASFRFK
jgi:hypothetical protein